MRWMANYMRVKERFPIMVCKFIVSRLFGLCKLLCDNLYVFKCYSEHVFNLYSKCLLSFLRP